MLDKIMTVTVREYKATVKTKTFLISMIIVPIFMFAGLIVVKFFGDSVDTTDKNIAIIDRSAIVASAVISAAEERNRNEIFETENNKSPKIIFERKFIFIITECLVRRQPALVRGLLQLIVARKGVLFVLQVE